MISCCSGSLLAIAFALSIGTQVHGAFVPVSISENLDNIETHRGVQQAVTCGGLTCLNGGICGQGHDYNITAAVCDCTAAFLIEQAVDMKATQFVGKTCEIEVYQNDYCSGNTDLFCVNGGTCRSEAENFRDDPCDCKEGFKGRHCEYQADNIQQECALTCNGKGKCEHGFNPNSNVGAEPAISVISINPSKMTTNFTHCVCEEGFAGPSCEFDFIKCDGRGIYCFHGSTCSENGSCNCTAAGDGGWGILGEFCEYKASDSCNSPTPITVENAELLDLDPSLKMTQSQNPFCVNDGLCYKINNVDEFFCYCEAGISGLNCEIVSTLSPAPSPPLTESPAPTTMASVTDKPATATVTNKPVMETGMTNKPTAKRTGAGPPTTWPPTRAPIESSQASQNSDEDEGMGAGAKVGITLAVMFGAVLAMGYTLGDPPARRPTRDQGNTGEHVLSENNTQGSQSQHAIPENISSEANVTTAGDDALPAVV